MKNNINMFHLYANFILSLQKFLNTIHNKFKAILAIFFFTFFETRTKYLLHLS